MFFRRPLWPRYIRRALKQGVMIAMVASLIPTMTDVLKGMPLEECVTLVGELSIFVASQPSVISQTAMKDFATRHPKALDLLSAYLVHGTPPPDVPLCSGTPHVRETGGHSEATPE
jgi:hypothetical protein